MVVPFGLLPRLGRHKDEPIQFAFTSNLGQPFRYITERYVGTGIMFVSMNETHRMFLLLPEDNCDVGDKYFQEFCNGVSHETLHCILSKIGETRASIKIDSHLFNCLLRNIDNTGLNTKWLFGRDAE